MVQEIRFSGFGGQGIVRCALITGKALALYDSKFSCMTQSFGPEARGGYCSSQLVVSTDRIAYPYVTRPGVLVSLSQEAYFKYVDELADGGTLIVEAELVKPRDEDAARVNLFPVPATRIAEEVGNRLFANLVVLGFFSAVTGIVSIEAIEKALPDLVPARFMKANITAMKKGFEYGTELLAKEGRVPETAGA